MKISYSTARFLITLVATGAASYAHAMEKALTIGARTLTVQAPAKCAPVHRPGRELAKYLSQYDPSEEPNEDIRDETPWTKEEILSEKKSIVEWGFRYPNDQDSVITWMDFDGDGICDFTASAGFGGMRSVDRMFLFRGLPNKGFRLVNSSYSYMDSVSVLVPYIPITVSGEKLPILASHETLLQWQGERKQFSTCATITYGPQAAKERAAAPVLAMLCPSAQQIYAWAADQMPHKNEMPHSNIED